MLLTKHGKAEDAEKLMRGELRELDLFNCWIGDDEAVKVAAFIKDDDSVEKVGLWGNMIGPRGAKAIAEALKHNRRIRLLGLSSNQIGQEGADALIDALNYNVCLMGLPIYNNNIARESEATIEYLTETRNAKLIPAAVRSASLCLIAVRRNAALSGDFFVFPKEIVRMIAMEVWETRNDPKWIEAVSSAAHVEEQKSFVEKWVRDYEALDSDSD